MNRYPVVLSMDCLDGFHVSRLPGSGGMVVTRLRQRLAGAFGPSGLGLSYQHDYLHLGFEMALYQQRLNRLGLAADWSRAYLHANDPSVTICCISLRSSAIPRSSSCRCQLTGAVADAPRAVAAVDRGAVDRRRAAALSAPAGARPAAEPRTNCQPLTPRAGPNNVFLICLRVIRATANSCSCGRPPPSSTIKGSSSCAARARAGRLRASARSSTRSIRAGRSAGTEYVDPNLTNGTTYCYKLEAIDSGQNSEFIPAVAVRGVSRGQRRPRCSCDHAGGQRDGDHALPPPAPRRPARR
jgi:hypothetical protein